MSEDGTSFTIDLPVTGQGSIDAASASLVKLDGALGNTSKASQAASGSIQATEASYRQAERSADAAAKAVERIGVAATAQRGKLRAAMDTGDDKSASRAAAMLQNLTQRQAEAATKAATLSAALKTEAAALDKLKGSVEKVEKPAAESEIHFGQLGRSLNKLGGPLGEFGAKGAEFGHAWEGLTKNFGTGGAAASVAAIGIVALGAAVIALSAAVADSVIKIGTLALGLADANRSALLLSQGIAHSVAGGTLLDDKISDLTKRLPLTREELSSTAERLSQAGLRGQDLSNALERSATAAAKLKFGPNFQDQMLSLDEQSKVFHENLLSIFGGLKVEGLLKGLQTLGALFDADTESGKAIKVVFESLFQPLIDGLTGAAPKIERFFIQFEIMALKALIAIKPYGSTILKVGEAFVIGAAVLVGIFVVAVAAALAIVGIFLITLGAIAAAIVYVVVKVNEFGTSIGNFFKNLDMAAMGKAMIDGLVNGITNGAKAVLDAMSGVVHGAIDGAKHLLGISSPSKVFAEIGAQTGAGMSVGVEQSTSVVQDSLEKMAAPPGAGGTAPPAAAPSAKESGKGGANFAGAVFNLNGVEGAADAEARISALLTRLIEGDVAQIGAASPT